MMLVAGYCDKDVTDDDDRQPRRSFNTDGNDGDNEVKVRAPLTH